MSALEPGALYANRFEIERQAGRGGMGVVYRARDRYTGAAVALKLLHEGHGGAEGAERFDREARVLAELDHPGVVSHVAHGQTADGRRFLAMEWLDGEDLAARLTRGPLPITECVTLLRAVAAALEGAHRRGIVHRDLKPSNIFLVGGDTASPKVLDFGIARLSEGEQAMTRTGRLVGTPNYMAPEQARGAREITPAADVFSLGCVLYKCLSGRAPFFADHVAAILARILFEEPLPVEKHRPDVPQPLATLVQRMLAKSTAERFADAGALRAAIDALAEPAETLEAFTPPVASRPSSSFAEQEQALCSLVFASPRPHTSSGATVEVDDAISTGARRSAVQSALAAMGAPGDIMADGSLVVTVLGAGSARDQAAHAARAALVVKQLWPEAAVALATGRGAAEGPSMVGEVADRAARLLTRPEPASGVWVDELSARLLGSRFEVTPSPEGALLTGREKDVDLSRPLLGKPTPCVGREAELASLEAQIAACIEASEARAVLVTAPPGAGKSRLWHELERRITRLGAEGTMLVGRGDAMSAGAPYGILGAAIRRLCGVTGGEPVEEQRRLLQERIGRHLAAAERERVVCFMGEMCGVSFPDEGLPMLQTARQEPKIMGDCLRRAVLDWLAAECGAGPVLVVLDDLHWGDALTVSVLGTALGEQAATPFFVLALARPEIHETFPRLWADHQAQEIVLRGLGRRACERLIKEVLGKDVPPAVLDRAVDQSAGNALFLEELIRSIAEGKAEGAPETVVAMLQARIGRLPSGPGRALRAASVFGPAFRDGGVAAVLGLPGAPGEVADWLSALVEAELIRPDPASRPLGERAYSFRHALMRDAAYGLLTESDLATGHLLAGEFLEAAGEPDAALVAEHFERAGELPRAAALYMRAAEEILPSGDYNCAERMVARGMACAPEGEVLGRLKSVLCAVAFHRNAHEGTSEVAREALALLRPGSLGWCRAMPAAIMTATRSPGRMVELLSLLGSTDPEPDARVAYIENLSFVGGYVATAPEPVLEVYLARLESVADAASESIPAVRRYFLYARCIVGLGRHPRPWSVLSDMTHAIELARRVGDQKVELAGGILVTELTWLELGDAEGARRRMLALKEKLDRSQEGLLAAAWAFYLVRILCEAPDQQAWEQAESLLPQALSDPRGTLRTAEGIRARVAYVRGQIEKAEEIARVATEKLTLTLQFWMITAPVHIRALMALGRAEEARVATMRVKGALQTLGGAGCYEVEARLAIAEAFEAAGDREQARAELAETVRQIKLRAEDITDPFWRESYLLRNPYCASALSLAAAWGLEQP